MGMESTPGVMVDAMRALTIKIKSMALGSTSGLIAANTKVIGLKASSTAKVNTYWQMALLKLEFGSKVVVSSGWLKHQHKTCGIDFKVL